MKDTAIIAIAAAAVPTILFLISVWMLVVFIRSYESKLTRLKEQVKSQGRTHKELKLEIDDLKLDLAEAQQDAINEGRIVDAQQQQISKIESLCSTYIAKPGTITLQEFWKRLNAITGANAGGGS